MVRFMRRGFAAALIVVALPFIVAAQQQPPQPQQRDAPGGGARPANAPAAAPGTLSNVDENFELDIAERRITGRDFFASTAIEAGEGSAHGLSLRIGVAVGASEIDVLLRNVRGRVRFRGSLEVLQRVLDARRPASASPATQIDVP
jgi:hypothetical protein